MGLPFRLLHLRDCLPQFGPDWHGDWINLTMTDDEKPTNHHAPRPFLPAPAWPAVLPLVCLLLCTPFSSCASPSAQPLPT